MMLLIDKYLKEHGENIIQPFCQERVSNICYDLRTEYFCIDEGMKKSCELKPGACVFVQAKESIKLPNNMYAQVVLRNKRIRQGLSLTAPVYQPGHHTKVFFRIQNVSSSVISLKDQDLASLMLYKLDDNVDHPYDGSYTGQFSFRGLGTYAPELLDEITDIEEKVNDVKEIEKSIYGNVLAIMAIFVAIFSLINVNVQLVAKSVDMKTLLTLNLVTFGSIAALIASVQAVIPGKNKRWIWIAGVVAYVAAVIVQFLPIA